MPPTTAMRMRAAAAMGSQFFFVRVAAGVVMWAAETGAAAEEDEEAATAGADGVDSGSCCFPLEPKLGLSGALADSDVDPRLAGKPGARTWAT